MATFYPDRQAAPILCGGSPREAETVVTGFPEWYDGHMRKSGTKTSSVNVPEPGRVLPLPGTRPEPAPANPLDLRILSYYPEIRAIRRGEIPAPRMAILYPVYGCNLDCIGCEYAADNAQGFVMLEPDRLLQLVDELAAAGVEGIEFCGGGEPTLHPAFIDAVERGAARGLRFGLLTNGTALSEAFRVRALPHFAYVRVTLDAADAAMYGIVRPAKGRNPWERVLENIRAMVRQKNEQGLATELGVKFLVGRRNRGQLAAAVALAEGLGVDNIQFKALRLDPDELDAEQSRAVEAELAGLRTRTTALTVLGSVRKLEMHRPCELTPLQVTIDAHGEVYLCCYFRHRAERHGIGNIHEISFADLWGTERHRAAIEAIQPKECSVLDCRFVRYHEVVDRVFDADPDHYSFI